MSRLTIMTATQSQRVIEELYKDLERRIIASPPGLCPVDMASAFLKLCHAQTCGKCVPCRVGLAQLQLLLEDVLEGRASLDTIDLIEKTAQNISWSADCAIGYEAAEMVLKGVRGFRDDYEEHILHGRCTASLNQPVPCVSMCPAGVDIPGYIALVKEGRNADAVRLIRKDNPFPTVCAYICEHPCEARCRRSMLDDPVNVRGIKRYAVDHAGFVPAGRCAPPTGKRVAIVGGGPGGLSAAYYLQLMGHQSVIYEKRRQLGGMLRYGIPNYRLPRKRLDEEIDVILSTGVEVHLIQISAKTSRWLSWIRILMRSILPSVRRPTRKWASPGRKAKMSSLLSRCSGRSAMTSCRISRASACSSSAAAMWQWMLREAACASAPATSASPIAAGPRI